MKKLLLLIFILAAFTAKSQVYDYTVKGQLLQVDTGYVKGSLPEETGSRYYDDDDETTTLVLPNGIRLQDGQELFIPVLNQSGGTLLNGRAVRYSGTVGMSGKLNVEYIIADGTHSAISTLGILTQDVLNGDQGKVTWFGKVREINTSGNLYGETWADGDTLYVSTTIDGGLTKYQPEAPYEAIQIGWVVKADNNVGEIFVRPSFPLPFTANLLLAISVPVEYPMPMLLTSV